MKKPLILTTIFALSLALGSGSALSAPGKGKGKNKSKPQQSAKRDKGKEASKFKRIPPGQAKKQLNPKGRGEVHAELRNQFHFHDRDRDSLQSHFKKYKQHPHGLPPGLAKKLQRGKPLPPGWQKKVTKGWVIDDSWWSHFQPVPSTYLPPSLKHPKDTSIYLIGDRLVRVHRPRREVIDLIRISTLHPHQPRTSEGLE